MTPRGLARSVRVVAVAGLVVGGALRTRAAEAAACSQETTRRVREPATAADDHVALDCDLTLAPDDVVTKRLVLPGAEASGTVLDCMGARLDGSPGQVNAGRDMIEIRSRRRVSGDGVVTWESPRDVTIRHCRVAGSVRVWGMGRNGEAEHVRASSREAGHVDRLRAAAPADVRLHNLQIVASGRTPLYVGPGVQRVTLEGSELTGTSTSVAIYLDTESAGNTIRDNDLHVVSRHRYAGGLYVRKREEIAIDGSQANLIMGNRFRTLEGGGVHLYRNCGEGGTVRHGIPRDNVVVGNVFDYEGRRGRAAVFLGSRVNGVRGYCSHDRGFAWGSSVDDRNFVRFNVVEHNRVVRDRGWRDVRVGSRNDRPNDVRANVRVAVETSGEHEGCVVPGGYKRWIASGETLDVFAAAGGGVECGATAVQCRDGVLAEVPAEACVIRRRGFSCVAAAGEACRVDATCPAGTRVVAAEAVVAEDAASEQGAASEAGAAMLAGRVRRPRVGGREGRLGVIRRPGESLRGFVDAEGFVIGCSGEGCAISGEVMCR